MNSDTAGMRGAVSRSVSGAERRERQRITQLDGLRGMAALVVVFHHALLVDPGLGQQHGTRQGDPMGMTWWLSQTPLRLLWDGQSAVLLFFVLSGFVLTLPFVGSRIPRWCDYYPRRIARLYLPVWGAVAFTVLLIQFFPRIWRPEQSWWVNAHVFQFGSRELLKDATLVAGFSGLNTPLWSLQYEVLFSLLLPLYVLGAVRFRRFWLPILGAIILIVLFAPNGYALYLPMFGVGAIMAVRRDLLDHIAEWLPRWAWPMLLAVSLLLISATWCPVRLPGATLLAFIGVSLLFVIFYGWDVAKRLGDSRPAQWAGRTSFSLYLIHEPIIVSVAMATVSANPFLILAVSVPVSLLFASFFYRCIELPAHLFSKRIGLPWRRDKLARSNLVSPGAGNQDHAGLVGPVDNSGTTPHQ